MVNKQAWRELTEELIPAHVTLLAVSKTKPAEDILELYGMGQRDFGENYVQELMDKQSQLPADIRWHFIGHLQSNKVKFIAPFVHMVHAVDSFKLLTEINKQAAKNNRVIDVLLQMYIAGEDTKFGMDEKEMINFLDYFDAQKEQLKNVRICGLMGMATNTENEQQLHAEFFRLHNFFRQLADSTFYGKDYFTICSMGMTADYRVAVAEGSSLVRIGSRLFGGR